MTKTKKNSKTKKNRSCVNTLKDIIFTGGTNTFRLIRALKNAVSEIERLRQERDEARREACRGEAIIRLQRHRVHRESEEVVRMAKEIAVERGWDCFKENTNE